MFCLRLNLRYRKSLRASNRHISDTLYLSTILINVCNFTSVVSVVDLDLKSTKIRYPITLSPTISFTLRNELNIIREGFVCLCKYYVDSAFICYLNKKGIKKQNLTLVLLQICIAITLWDIISNLMKGFLCFSLILAYLI